MRSMHSLKKLPLLLSLVLGAAPVLAADLMQVYREAQANDAQYAVARAQAEAGRERLPQGRAGLLPTVAATANKIENRNVSNGRDLNYPSDGYNVSLTQPLFRWQNWVQYDQSRLQVAQAEATLAQAQQDLIVRVAQAYFDVLYAEENLRSVRANKVSIVQQLEQAKKNFEVGTATITDTHEAQARFDLATALEIAAENDLEVRRQALRVITGKETPALNPLKPQATLAPPQPASMDRWADAAQADSFIVQAQQAAAGVAEKEIERTRAGHLPTVDLVANYGNANSVLPGLGTPLETDVRNIGLQLNLPIFQGGFINSRTREAIANRDVAAGTLENARRTAALSARQAYLGVVNGLAQVRALEAAVVSSNSALEANRVGYEVGVRINIDVLNAEQQLYVARRDLARARFDTLISQLRLQAAVGALGEDELQRVNALLEPLPSR